CAYFVSVESRAACRPRSNRRTFTPRRSDVGRFIHRLGIHDLLVDFRIDFFLRPAGGDPFVDFLEENIHHLLFAAAADDLSEAVDGPLAAPPRDAEIGDLALAGAVDGATHDADGNVLTHVMAEALLDLLG